MATNVNTNAVANGKLYTIDGVECVYWRGSELSTLPLDTVTTIATFKAATGNDPEFMAEWARNRYPMYNNGWLLQPVASHLEDAQGVCAVQFVVSSAVCPLVNETYGMLIVSRQSDGTIKAELNDIVQTKE